MNIRVVYTRQWLLQFVMWQTATQVALVTPQQTDKSCIFFQENQVTVDIDQLKTHNPDLPTHPRKSPKKFYGVVLS